MLPAAGESSVAARLRTRFTTLPEFRRVTRNRPATHASHRIEWWRLGRRKSGRSHQQPVVGTSLCILYSHFNCQVSGLPMAWNHPLSENITRSGVTPHRSGVVDL